MKSAFSETGPASSPGRLRWRWPRPPARRLLGIASIVAPLLLASGCQPRRTRFEITDYRDDAPPAKYFEDFDECFYALDADGTLDVVARRVGSTFRDPNTGTTQVLHVRRIWPAVPGMTHVERTQINARVSYWIVGASGGIGFEGGGFVTCNENRAGDVLTGRLELSALTPTRRVEPAPDLFQHAEVTGTFRARRDKRRIVRILNKLERTFGPLPRYDAPPPPF
jgi:hypothetical protein